MLKNVIKRNGEIEPFIPSKLNKWSEWASIDERSDNISWSNVVLNAVQYCNETTSSQDLQKLLIESCKSEKTEAGLLMAGKLSAVYYQKMLLDVFQLDKLPTVKWLHDKLLEMGYMKKLNYTQQEYDEIESFINHKKDFRYYEYQLSYTRSKYFIQDKNKKQVYETNQFAYMRVAMFTCEHLKNKVKHVKELYNIFSDSKLNIPTTIFNSFGTIFPASASCCLYLADDNKESIAAANHITENMTLDGAGLGNAYHIRSINDPIRKGSIIHKGKLPYYSVLTSLVMSSMQGSRGGAATTYVSAYDPEIMDILILPNEKTPKNIRNDKIQYGIMINSFLSQKAILNENIFLFNNFTAPDLYQSLFSSDINEFITLYKKYENDNSFKKTYLNARKLLDEIRIQEHQTSKIYRLYIDEVNRHTPYKEPIKTSNLCIEITNVTKPYQNVSDLYLEEDHGRGEVGICTLGAINVDVENDEEYFKLAYYSLLVADKSIDTSNFKLKHVGFTSRARRNAAIGMVNVAYVMAKHNFKYNSKAGLEYINYLAERHSYMLIKASLELGKEFGNATWINKTKWSDGWLPIDTYNKNIDKYLPVKLNFDWENLRKDIINNKGIRHSSLVAHMPVKSSYKASGVTQSVYPAHKLFYMDIDGSNCDTICVPGYDKYKDNYQSAYEIDINVQSLLYGVIQKFTDQGISANEYFDRIKQPVIKSEDAISNIIFSGSIGLKTKYYTVTKIEEDIGEIDKNKDQEELIDFDNQENNEGDCENCSL